MDAQKLLTRLLEQAPGGGFQMRMVPRADIDDELLAALHKLSNAHQVEPYEQFCSHALSHDALHVFRRCGQQRIEGFQFWRSVPVTPMRRLVLGGKLRIHPEARRHGLHLAAGLSMLLAERAAHPDSTITRVGMASLFGFVSIARCLADYDFVTRGGRRREILDTVDRLARESGYRFDVETGQVDVGAEVTDAQLAPYPERYFQLPEARAYLARNPDFRRNGRYLAFAFDLNDANLRALTHSTSEAILGPGEAAERWARELRALL